MKSKMRLENKVVIITGGAQGIGKATGIRCVEEGAKIVIVDIDDEKGTEVVDYLRKGNKNDVLFIHADISNEEDIIRMSEMVMKKYGKIDILINCALKGIIKGIDATVDEWIEVFMTNVVGYALCIKHCLEGLKRCNSGSVINIASISGFIAQPQYLTYSTCKGALVNMTRCLAMDLAQYNIRVNNVCPSTIWTENNAFFMKRDYGVTKEEANKHPEIGGKHLLNRVGEPEEVANAILFLASDEASFITGENLMVDGGYMVKG